MTKEVRNLPSRLKTNTAVNTLFGNSNLTEDALFTKLMLEARKKARKEGLYGEKGFFFDVHLSRIVFWNS